MDPKRRPGEERYTVVEEWLDERDVDQSRNLGQGLKLGEARLRGQKSLEKRRPGATQRLYAIYRMAWDARDGWYNDWAARVEEHCP